MARTFFLAFTSLLILLAMQHSRGEVHAPKKSYTRHPRFPTHFAGHHVLISPGWRTACLGNIACDSDIFPKNSRRQKIKYDRIELFTPRYQHSGTLNDANQHALIFFSIQWPGSESPVLQKVFSDDL